MFDKQCENPESTVGSLQPRGVVPILIHIVAPEGSSYSQISAVYLRIESKAFGCFVEGSLGCSAIEACGFVGDEMGDMII